MFENIPESLLNRMRELEALDAHDRSDGTARSRRLRQIPPETGKLIAFLDARVDALILPVGKGELVCRKK